MNFNYKTHIAKFKEKYKEWKKYNFTIPTYDECLKAFDKVLVNICKEENIELIRCNSFESLNEIYNSDGSGNALGLYITYKKDKLSYENILGQMVEIPLRTRIIILKEPYEQQRLPVFTLAHELGHHFDLNKRNSTERNIINSNSDKERRAEEYILKLAKEHMNPWYFKNFDFDFYTRWYSITQYKK